MSPAPVVLQDGDRPSLARSTHGRALCTPARASARGCGGLWEAARWHHSSCGCCHASRGRAVDLGIRFVLYLSCDHLRGRAEARVLVYTERWHEPHTPCRRGDQRGAQNARAPMAKLFTLARSMVDVGRGGSGCQEKGTLNASLVALASASRQALTPHSVRTTTRSWASRKTPTTPHSKKRIAS